MLCSAELSIKEFYNLDLRETNALISCAVTVQLMWNFTAVSPEITDDYWIFGDN